MVRRIIFYKSYFRDFFDKQSEKTKEKVDYVLDLIANANRVPEKFLKHLEGTEGLYEIRVQYSSNNYRLFCCFDEGQMVVVFNGFQKKSEKTSRKELERAKQIKREYFDEKFKLRNK